MSFNCTEVKRILSGSFHFKAVQRLQLRTLGNILSSNDLSISSYPTSIAAGGLLSIHHPSISTVFTFAPLQPRLHYFQCHQNDKLKLKNSRSCVCSAQNQETTSWLLHSAPPQHFNRGKHFSPLAAQTQSCGRGLMLWQGGEGTSIMKWLGWIQRVAAAGTNCSLEPNERLCSLAGLFACHEIEVAPRETTRSSKPLSLFTDYSC